MRDTREEAEFRAHVTGTAQDGSTFEEHALISDLGCAPRGRIFVIRPRYNRNYRSPLRTRPTARAANTAPSPDMSSRWSAQKTIAWGYNSYSRNSSREHLPRRL